MILVFLSCLVFSYLTFSLLKIWGEMTDLKAVTKDKSEANFVPSQDPFPASDSSEEPLQKNGDSSSLPETPNQAELASHKDPKDACQQRTSKPPLYRNPPRNSVSSSDDSPANGTGTQGLEALDTSGLSSPARSQGQRTRPLSAEDKKQAHIKRQLMTNFILGSFDDNSSDEDPVPGSFGDSSRRGSRASSGAQSLEAALTSGDSETPAPTIR